tara:strand:- start:5968 stop:6195 length:228 start_codon:yes stop_codon:yes gene_type:complete
MPKASDEDNPPDPKDITEVPVPEKSRPGIAMRSAALRQAQRDMEQYMEGMVSTLALEGTWDVDIRRMMLVKLDTG